MSFRQPNQGYGGMSMPTPQPYSNHQQTPYPSNTSYTPKPTCQSINEVDLWMDQFVANLNSSLKDKTSADLEELLNNEDKLNELVEDSEQTKKLKRKREEIVQLNKDQAVTNISLKPGVELSRTNLCALAKQQNEMREKYTNMQHKLFGMVSIDSVSDILQAATAEKESESDNISQTFIDGHKSVEEFIDQFIPERKTYQLRKVKSEKMQELLRTGIVNVHNPTPMPRPHSNAIGGGGYGYNRGYGGY